MSVTKQIALINQAFITGLKTIIPDKLFAVYIYGAAAFPDSLPTGDIDFHVILNSELTDTERERLEAFHASLAATYPPLGGELDGYYILLKDATTKIPPKSQMWKRATDDSWALHREHILHGRYIKLHGPDPKKIYKPTTWPELKKALYGELDYIERNLQKYPDYCILNLSRLYYSFESKDVVISKDKASRWAMRHLPRWKKHIRLARASYAHRGKAAEREFMLSNVDQFNAFVKERIAKRGRREC